MPDNTTLPGTGDVIATDDIAGVKYQIIKPAFGALDTATLVSAADPMPVTVANASFAVTGTFYQATQPVSGTVTANAGSGTFAVSGPLTDTQLRLAPVPVSLTSTTVTGSVAVTGTFWQATQPVSLASTTITGSVAVTGPLTDAQLRAAAVPVSAASLPLPAGAATETTVAGVRTDLGTDGTTPPAVLGAGTGVRGWLRSIYEKLTGTLAVTGTFWQATQPVSGTVTVNTISGFATEATLAARVPVNGQALMAASVPVTLASNQSALPVTGTFWQATQPVSGTVAFSNTTIAVTNAGTFAVQSAATLSAETTKVIGTVNVAASQTIAVTNTGTFAVQSAATLAAETTKVIGTVNIAAAQTLATVTTVAAVTAITNALPTGANVIGGVTQSGTWNVGSITTLPALVAGAAIVGKVGIDQTTPGTTNLVALTAETTKIIGTVNVSSKQTYRASTIIPLVAAVTVNVPFFNIIGSATKTVIVKRITVSGMTLTAVGYFAINAEKLSTASTAGTSTTLVATALDSTNAAVTAVVKAYTAAPTKGTLVGTLRSWRHMWQSTTAAAAGTIGHYDFDFGDVAGSGGVVLRGVAQELALIFPVVLASAGTLSVDIEWTEE